MGQGALKQGLLTGTGIFLASLAFSNTAAAQAQQGERNATTAQIEEVIVTARKRTENIQTIPITIKAMSAETLSQMGIRRIDDIQLAVTNLTLAKSQANSINAIIRGVGSNRNVNGVGFFYDDVQDFNAFAVRITDVERMEVLKGPQATLYGGLNIGGAIKYVLKRPKFEPEGEAELIAGSRSYYSAYAGMTGPLSDNIAVRLSAYGDKRDGLFRNLYNGSRVGGQREYGGRAAFLVRSGPFDAYLSLRASDFRTTRAQLLGVAPTPDTVSYDVYVPESTFLKIRTISPTLILNYDFGSVKATSISGYISEHARYYQDSQNVVAPAGFPLPYLPLARNDKIFADKTWQQELRLTSDDTGPFTWIVGAYYLGRDAPNKGILQNLDLPPALTVLRTTPNDIVIRTRQSAVFATASYKLTSQIEASIGARFNHSKNSFTDFVRNETYLKDGVSTILPVNTVLSVTENSILPRFDVRYRPSDHLMLYGSVSTGIQPAATATSLAITAQPFKAEHSTQYEVGVKSDLADGRVRLNVAGFYAPYNDRLFTNAVNDLLGQSIRITRNIGNATNWGFEVELAAKPAPELTLQGGVGYLSSKWKSHTLYTYQDLRLPAAQRQPITVDIGGRSSPGSPDWTLNGSVDWEHPIAGDLSLVARADVSHTGRIFWDLIDTYKTRPYTLINAAVGVKTKRVGLMVAVRNLADTRYNLDYLPQRDFGAPTSFANPGERRRVEVQLNASF